MDPEPDASSVSVSGEAVVTEVDVRGAIAELPLFRRKWFYLAGAMLLVTVYALVGHASPSGLVPFGLFTALFQGYLFLGPRLMAKRTLAAMPDRTMRYRADDNEITIASAGSTVTRSWALITQYREEKNAFLLWSGPYGVQVILKRAFKEQDVSWLRGTLARKVAPSKGAKGARAAATRPWRLVLIWVVLVLAFLALWQFFQSGPR